MSPAQSGNPLKIVLKYVELPALLISARRRIVHLNAAAANWLAANPNNAQLLRWKALPDPRLVTVRLNGGDWLVIVQAIAPKPFEVERLELAGHAWALTSRERDVLRVVADGLTNKQIAAVLKISEPTVENHLTHVFRKAGVANRTSLLSRLLRSPAPSPPSSSRARLR